MSALVRNRWVPKAVFGPSGAFYSDEIHLTALLVTILMWTKHSYMHTFANIRCLRAVDKVMNFISTLLDDLAPTPASEFAMTMTSSGSLKMP